MTGIVILTHSQLGKALIEAAEGILGKTPESVVAVSTDTNDPDSLHEIIARGIKTVDRSKGVLIFTDMFGGTPCNVGCSFLEEGEVDVISSVNLPILLKAVNSRKAMKFDELSRCLEAYGKKSITLASGILKGNRRTDMSLCPFGSECM